MYMNAVLTTTDAVPVTVRAVTLSVTVMFSEFEVSLCDDIWPLYMLVADVLASAAVPRIAV